MRLPHTSLAADAEWRDVPYANVVYCPCVMPGRAAPPAIVRTQSFPPWINALLWQLGGPVVDFATRGAINRGRAGSYPQDRGSYLVGRRADSCGRRRRA